MLAGSYGPLKHILSSLPPAPPAPPVPQPYYVPNPGPSTPGTISSLNLTLPAQPPVHPASLALPFVAVPPPIEDGHPVPITSVQASSSPDASVSSQGNINLTSKGQTCNKEDGSL